MNYPQLRLRRLRNSSGIRNLVAENRLSIKDIIYPIFVIFGSDKKIPIASMPGIFHFSPDRLSEEIEEISRLGINSILLFGLPEFKDSLGTSAWDSNGPVQEAIKICKDKYPEIVVVTDVCMCEYTNHGHCGQLDKNGYVDNDLTLELLAKEALSHAKAGADIVAPSDMMDGRVAAIRDCLDKHNYSQVPIMAYSAKYASAFYGPFREAADSAPVFGDRMSYQMNFANLDEALREVQLDINEGADIVMVKPALAYLDVIKAVKEKFGYPTAAYNVSGEYAMIKAAAAQGWIDENRAIIESITCIKRAGADIIITYFAKEIAKLLD